MCDVFIYDISFSEPSAEPAFLPVEQDDAPTCRTRKKVSWTAEEMRLMEQIFGAYVRDAKLPKPPGLIGSKLHLFPGRTSHMVRSKIQAMQKQFLKKGSFSPGK